MKRETFYVYATYKSAKGLNLETEIRRATEAPRNFAVTTWHAGKTTLCWKFKTPRPAWRAYRRLADVLAALRREKVIVSSSAAVGVKAPKI